jgi:hypothetical protein
VALSLRDRLIAQTQARIAAQNQSNAQRAQAYSAQRGAQSPATPRPPARPPAGYYDPAIDEMERAGARGVGDLRIDTDTANERASTGWITNTGRLGEDRDTSLAGLLRSRNRGVEDIETGTQDLERGYRRSLSDLLRDRTRGREDFDTAVAGRRRSYTQLGQSQAQGIQAAGVAGGGALRAALAARKGNEAIEAAGQQRTYDRFDQDIGTSKDRLGEDYDTGRAGFGRARQRLADDYDLGVADVNRAYQRSYDDEGAGYQYGVDDRGLGLARAEREQTFLGTGAAAQRAFQAAAAGYRPPKKGRKR